MTRRKHNKLWPAASLPTGLLWRPISTWTSTIGVNSRLILWRTCRVFTVPSLRCRVLTEQGPRAVVWMSGLFKRVLVENRRTALCKKTVAKCVCVCECPDLAMWCSLHPAHIELCVVCIVEYTFGRTVGQHHLDVFQLHWRHPALN